MKHSFICFVLLGGGIIAVNSTTAAFKDDLCLNGSRDDSGKCVCRSGYAEFRGNCFMSHSPALSGQSHVRTRSNNFCPPGFNILNGRCEPTVCTGTLCESSCAPGYVLRAGFCEIPNPQCPPGTIFQNGYCYYQPVPPKTETISPMEKVEIVPPLRIDIPVPEFIDPLDPNEVHEGSDEEDTEIVPDRRPLNGTIPVKNVVNNVNTVSSPSNVTTHNVNNVFIHITRRKSTGAIKAVVIRNNETTVYDESPPQKKEDRNDENEESTIEPETSKPCCIVVSPRICRKQEPDEWVCFHRKHYRCGSFCTAEVIYLKPRKPVVQNSVLLMPPAMGYSPLMRYGVCRWGKCPPVDCSGCLQGSYRCHITCYTYDCAQQDGCNFINHEEFCDDNDDEICTAIE
ncbi:uncharacterized protein LOC131681530 [Topomyia yanbarensis]|uniref:uncharacterized protein LOC131681530 n=1 Tax=Topomyia yanbarensis TaxID=2498891 RepID=UPI00273CA0D3|nr:uncharacterized protein LOC131681530 [Topomyia yanbarensis]